MGLNPSKGNMYEFVTHTWNTVKGACPHDCSYCYMKRFKNLKPVRFDKREMKTDLGIGNFIFVGSSCDLFARSIPHDWIANTLLKTSEASGNKYLFQSKDPFNMSCYRDALPPESIVCTTIETNRIYPEIMRTSPIPEERADGMKALARFPRYVTIEPVLDFDLDPLIELIKKGEPVQVNIGADSGGNNLPEPPADKLAELIDRLKTFTTIAKKRNLERIFAHTV